MVGLIDQSPLKILVAARLSMEERSLARYAAGIGGRMTDSDDSLVVAAVAGDTHAYEELYRRHSKQIFRTVLRIVRNLDDAEDIVQESLMKAFRHLAVFKRQSAFSTWVTRIAINSALQQLRRRRQGLDRFFAMSDEFENVSFDHFVEDSPSPEALLVHAEITGALARAITLLPPSLREVITIHCYNDASTRDIAIVMSLSEPAVKTRLHRARSRLRQSMLKQYGEYVQSPKFE
jgi:RNA polymerase sigma-70 factor, ECF subfamily